MTTSRMQRAGSGRLPIPVTHPDKVFWPDEGYTKLDLANFYGAIFPHLAPFVKDRLLTLERCPDGMRGECFYQREAPRGLPPGTPTKRVRDAKGSTEYVVGGSRATQLALVNLGCIAVHIWNSRAEAPRRPAPGARLSRPLPERVRADRGRALRRPPAAQGPCVDSAGLVGGDLRAPSVRFQSGQLFEAPRRLESMERLLSKTPVARCGLSRPQAVVAFLSNARHGLT